MRFNQLTKGFCLAAAMGASAALNAAVLSLTPGTFGAMPVTGTVPGAPGNVLAALISADVQDQPDLRFTAQVDSLVVANDANNALGGLSFYYRVSNVDDGVTEGRPLQGLVIPFDLPAAAVGVDQDVSGNLADIAELTSGGSSLSFVFRTDPVMLGESSAWLVVHTKFPSYKVGLVGVADGTTEDVAALVPIPEPTMFAGLFGLGLAAFAGYRRFRA